MAERDIDQKQRDVAVEMYQAGEKLAAITAATGLTRPTIYWILQQRGIRPSRLKKDESAIHQLEQALGQSLFIAQVLLDRLAEYEEHRRVGADDPRAARPVEGRSHPLVEFLTSWECARILPSTFLMLMAAAPQGRRACS